MPYTVNGCGTWYYGRKNRESYPGVCAACGRETTLESYDTRLFFVFIFIPIIPFRKRRIIDQCPVCSKHRSMLFSDWQVARTRIEESINEYRRQRGNAQKAEECLIDCLSIRDRQTFLTLAPELERDFSGHGKMLLMVAAGYDHVAQLADAERVLIRALEVNDDYDTRELLADVQLRQNKPEEAEPLLAHIIEEGIPDRAHHIYHLAQILQSQGDHERALAYFEHCEILDPNLASDPTFTALRSASQGHLGTNRKVEPRKIASRVKTARGFRRFARIASVILVLAAAVYGSIAWIHGKRPDVFLVNGVERPYQVRLNGTQYQVGPYSVIRVTVPEGEVAVEIPELAEYLPAESVSIHRPFLSRPFSKTVFVINPDRCALLRWTRTFYSANPSGHEPEDKFHAGRTMHVFHDIDYPFEEFPDSIRTESSSRTIPKTGVYLEPQMVGFDPPFVLRFLEDILGEDVIVQMVQRQLHFNPDSPELLGLASEMVAAEELEAILQSRLSDRPVRLGWHGAHLGAMRKLNRESELESYYAELLAKAPDDGDFLYLAARSSSDWRKSAELYRRAAQSESPCAYARTWMMVPDLAAGRYDSAVSHGSMALALMENDHAVRHMYRLALLAAGDYQKVMELAVPDTNRPFPSCSPAIADEVYARFLNGDTKAADEVIARVDKGRDRIGDLLVDEQIGAIKADLAYITGNVDEYVTIMRQSEYPEYRLRAAIAKRDMESVKSSLSDIPEPESDIHLLIFLLANLLTDQAAADENAAALVKLLADSDREDRWFAAALSGKEPVSVERIQETGGYPVTKALKAAALGIVSPEHREDCLRIAANLNFDQRFPHRLIKELIDRFGDQ